MMSRLRMAVAAKPLEMKPLEMKPLRMAVAARSLFLFSCEKREEVLDSGEEAAGRVETTGGIETVGGVVTAVGAETAGEEQREAKSGGSTTMRPMQMRRRAIVMRAEGRGVKEEV
jgi:hypothetical protein